VDIDLYWDTTYSGQYFELIVC
jgi:hypothetical protein